MSQNPPVQIAKPVPPRADIVTILKAPNTLQELAKALPRHLSVERFARVALTVVNANAELAKCTPASFMSCLVQSAQLGLELGSGLGEAYLIPFRNKEGEMVCTFIPGYRGLVKLARNAGNVKKIEATLVYQGDEFAVLAGLAPDIRHVPHAVMCGNTPDSGITHGYAFVVYNDGTTQFEVMTRAQIDAIRDRGRRNPVWNSDYAEMAKKTLLRRLCKRIQLSPELADAVTIDAEADEIIDLPARPQPAKYQQLVEADRQEQSDFREARAKLAAVAEFDAACTDAQAQGFDVEKILGVGYEQAMAESSSFLEAAAEKLRALKK